MKKLKVGDQVMVYSDPITKKEPEEIVTLVRRVHIHERWIVKFSNGEQKERWIDVSSTTTKETDK